MEFLVYALFHLLSIFSLFFVHSLCAQPIDTLASCLINYNVNNFTIYPSSNEDPSTYFHLLDLSIQNKRFAAPLVPKPIAIIIPESKEQLANSVVCCRKGSWEIRLRSGGHSYEGNSYIAYDRNPFVLIDMMNLSQVSVDVKSRVAWVEGGATLGQTYYSISELSRVHGFPAGSCPTVGIGGQISGGGFGSLFRKYGLAADNVVDALLIDANGRLLDRKGMGEDVFWAIRGGGGGVFGIVYAWKIRLLKVPAIVTGFIVSRPGSKSYVAELVHKWQNVAPKLVDEFYLSMVIGAHLPEMKTTGISATFKGLYLGPRNHALSILDREFPELGIVQGDCKEMSWIESILYFSGLNNGSSLSQLTDRYLKSKTYYKAKSDYVRTPISRNGVASTINILEKKPESYIILDPYGGAMEKISSESIAFPHRKGNLFMIQYVVEWNDKDHSKGKYHVKWIQEFYESMTPYVSQGPRASYINYIDYDLGVMDVANRSSPSVDAVEIARVWGEKYFLKNYDRLVKAKTLIDPLNVFRHEQGIFPMPTADGRANV
ncbi:FAD-binding Berberine family protein [Forsythia ovata]|uniref:FAD-binding Berberine family protein n=1 Tax=Forsythia ovata TaxID=205694 RepID=A0ABD1P721_9LAMI